MNDPPDLLVRDSPPVNGRRNGKGVWIGATAALALMALAIAALWPALSAGYVWDDALVRDNPLLRSFRGLKEIWTNLAGVPGKDIRYWPVLYTSFWVEFHLWGTRPFGYHLVNVLLHGLNGVLAWRVLRRLKVPGAWFAAALFVVHPVGVESVAWVIERKGVLSTTFYLVSVLGFLGWVERGRPRDLAGCVVWFVLALLTKPVMVTLPFALALVAWWKEKGEERKEKRETGKERREGERENEERESEGGREGAGEEDREGAVGGDDERNPWRSRKTLAGLGVLFVIALAAAAFNVWLAGRTDETHFGFTPIQRILLSGRAVWFYIGKLVDPRGLIAIYPRWDVAGAPAWTWVYPIGAAAALGALFVLHRRIGKGPFVAVAFFTGSLAPTLGILDFSYMAQSFVADRYTYLARLGLLALFAAGAARAAGRVAPRRPWPKLAAGLLLVLLGAMSFGQSRTFRNAETLFRHTLRYNPDAWGAHNGLGAHLAREGRFEEAVREYRESLRLNPSHVRAWVNLGIALDRLGKQEEAVEALRKAVSLEPSFADAHFQLANVLTSLHRDDEAEAQFQTAIRLDPANAECHYNYGIFLERKGKTDEAMKAYREAIEIDPLQSGARVNLGNLLAKRGDAPAADALYREALRVDPRNAEAWLNRANLLFNQGDLDGAERGYREAIRLRPDFGEAHNNLGSVLATRGDTAAAIQEFEKAVALNPDRADWKANLAKARADLAPAKRATK